MGRSPLEAGPQPACGPEKAGRGRKSGPRPGRRPNYKLGNVFGGSALRPETGRQPPHKNKIPKSGILQALRRRLIRFKSRLRPDGPQRGMSGDATVETHKAKHPSFTSASIFQLRLQHGPVDRPALSICCSLVTQQTHGNAAIPSPTSNSFASHLFGTVSSLNRALIAPAMPSSEKVQATRPETGRTMALDYLLLCFSCRFLFLFSSRDEAALALRRI